MFQRSCIFITYEVNTIIKMLKVVLIDDEYKSITSLEWELTNFCKEVEIVAKFTNPEKAVDYLHTHDIDCVFLDIQMPNMDGFQFLDCFQNRDFSVVITTAYDHYALSAIKESALDYLLKPIDTDDLIVAIEKIKKNKASLELKNSLEESILALSKNSSASSKKVAIPLDGKLIFLKAEEIIYCESDGNYCHIYLELDEKLFVTKKLKEIEELLPKNNFFRVHNSFVVNLEKVREYFKTDGYVILSNRKKIPVSRMKKSTFLDKM